MSHFRSHPFRKVVIPAAGLGTRMLPVTKVVSKEMLPICGKPLIQYAVEEAAASGLEEVILVIRPPHSQVADYFAPAPQLEALLAERHRRRELQTVRALSSLIRISVVPQAVQRGLGDAVLCARDAVGNEPFALFLPDAVIDSRRPVLAQLISAYLRTPGYFVATQPVGMAETSRFGILALSESGKRLSSRTLRVSGMVEKPQPRKAPSRFGVFGRYLLGPEIFDVLDATPTDGNGEVQLTDALAECCRKLPFYALHFEGTHFDTGNKTGYLEAILHFSSKDPELAATLRASLATLTRN
jgi:UTP--glucose-1-phosphate uridylyltransferase